MVLRTHWVAIATTTPTDLGDALLGTDMPMPVGSTTAAVHAADQEDQQ